MRRRLGPFLALMAALLPAACATGPTTATGSGACSVELAAELPVYPDPRYALVPARIDETQVALLVDTGSEVTLVTPEATRVLHLPPDPGRSSRLRGVGGIVTTSNAQVHHFAIGGMEAHDSSLVVGVLPSGFGASPPVYGLLGSDIMAGFDIDFDLPHQRLRFYRVHGCAEDVLDEDFSVAHRVTPVPVRRTTGGRLLLRLRLNDAPMTAILDSGAVGITLTRHAAERAGVTPAMLEQDPSDIGRGVDQNDIPLRRHRFTMEVGQEVFREQRIAVADIDLGGPDMLLGMDFLRQRRMWISYATSRLYLQPTTPADAIAPRRHGGFTVTLP